MISSDIDTNLHPSNLSDAKEHTDGLVQEKLNARALALELSFSCTYPSI